MLQLKDLSSQGPVVTDAWWGYTIPTQKSGLKARHYNRQAGQSSTKNAANGLPHYRPWVIVSEAKYSTIAEGRKSELDVPTAGRDESRRYSCWAVARS